MATLLTPTNFHQERWMRLPMPGPYDHFTFSGFAEFGPPTNDPQVGQALIGTGDNDSTDQRNYVDYEVTDMLVGPHWARVEGICPMVVAAGHEQRSPDEADGMGYAITDITEIDVVDLGAFKRIELHIACRVAGGFDKNGEDTYWAWGRIPALTYLVSAWGILHPVVGTEGDFWGFDTT